MDKDTYVAIAEAAAARQDLTIKRLWILCIIIFAAFVISNIAWIIYENQFMDIEVTQENTSGYNNYIGNDGDIYNGETDDQAQSAPSGW